MKRVATIVAIILAVITLLLVSWELRRIVVLFIVSLGIAATVRGPLDFLMKRGIPRVYGIAIIYTLSILALFCLVYGLSLPLGGEFERLSKDATTMYRQLETSPYLGRFSSILAARLPTSEQFAAFMTGGEQTSIARAIIQLTGTLVENISELLISIILSMYWITDEVRFERLWLSLLPGEQRTRARNAWRSLESGVGAYIRSELIQSILAGAFLAVGFRLIGLHYPVLWSLFIALAWLIPLVGPLIALIPLWLIASINGGWLLATLAVLYAAVVLGVMEFFVESRLYTRDRYAKVLVLLVMLALVDAFGLVGLLVAPIAATAIQILLNEIFAPPTPLSAEVRQANAVGAESNTGANTATVNVAALRARLEEVRALVNPMDQVGSKRITNMTERLEALLEKAEQI
jgi:putative permease